MLSKINIPKFPFADLLTALAALVFGFISFLSFNFLSLGHIAQSITLAFVFAIVFGGLAFGAKLLKKTSGNFKTCIILEWILLLLFLCASIVAIRPFSHFFAVSEHKDEIKPKVIANITQAEGMFADYEKYANGRINIYTSTLKSAVFAIESGASNRLFLKLGLKENTIANGKQVSKKILDYKNELYPSQYAQLKLEDSTWLANAKIAVVNWKPIRLITVLGDIEKNTAEWEKELKQFSTFTAQGENPNIWPGYSQSHTTFIGDFNRLGKPTSVSIIIAILLHFLMLLSYIVEVRSSKNPYSLFSFKKNNSKANQIDIEY